VLEFRGSIQEAYRIEQVTRNAHIKEKYEDTEDTLNTLMK
jgi:hypothetical protein